MRTHASTHNPDLAMPDGCEPIVPLPGVPFERSYVSGEPDGQRIRVRYFRRIDTHEIVAPCWFGPGCEGPPGHSHGGALAALLDEVMGVAAWNGGHAVVLARLTTHNRALLPLCTPLLCTASVVHVDGRKVDVRSAIVDLDGKPFVESDGLFVTIGLDRFRDMFNAANTSATAR